MMHALSSRLLLFIAGSYYCFAPLCAEAQSDPTGGPFQYPQFRNVSGLSGAGYGLDSAGYPSFTGPTAFSTPVAPVLGHGRLVMSTDKTSFSLRPTFDGKRTNGTAFFTYGQTIGSFNIALSDMIKSTEFDQSYNFQIQYVPRRGAKWIASAGAQDVLGNGGSAGEGWPRYDRLSSRSLFGVVTYQADTGRSPVYISAGIGTRRFHSGFASVSYHVGGPLRTWVEHDGFGFNYGVLVTWKPIGFRSSSTVFTLVGLQRGRFFTLSTGIAF